MNRSPLLFILGSFLFLLLLGQVSANCKKSSDCKDGFFCNIAESVCVEANRGEGCLVTGCPDKSHVCDSKTRRCVYVPDLRDGSCSANVPCVGGGVDCVSGRCVQRCRTDRDCDLNQHCFRHGPEKGHCIAFGCESDVDCPSGKECTHNTCTTRVSCVRGDFVKGDCGKGRSCTSAGLCLPVNIARCEMDSDCKNYGACYRGVCTSDESTYWRKKEAIHGSEVPTEVLSNPVEEKEEQDQEPEEEQLESRNQKDAEIEVAEVAEDEEEEKETEIVEQTKRVPESTKLIHRGTPNRESTEHKVKRVDKRQKDLDKRIKTQRRK